MKIPVTVIGMGMTLDDLTERHLAQIRAADLLIAGKRHLAHFEDLAVPCHPITANLSGLMEKIKRWMKSKRVVVLASGDPLFYGIGQQLIRTLGAENVEFSPNVTSTAAAFARLKLPWQDAKVISLHGRQNESALQQALNTGDLVAVMTDPKHDPAWLAMWMITNRLDGFDMCVCEQLGSPAEQCRWLTPPEAPNERFAHPNLVILRRRQASLMSPEEVHLGMPESAFAHQDGLITKAEVRAITLSKLRLASGHVLWDLGAGSGSVAIEAGLFIRKGHIIAVEKVAERVVQIRANQKRFKVKNLTVVHGALPQALNGLRPRPDRVFIGGGGKKIVPIVKAAAAALKPDGVMVINTVLVASLHRVIDNLQRLDWQTDVVQVLIHRSRPMPYDLRFESENPVWIITAVPPVAVQATGRRHG